MIVPRAAALAAAALLAVAFVGVVSADAQAVSGSYIYTLSSFTGAIPYNHSRVAVDRERNEVYVLYQNTIRVFNDSGMEVYRFGDDLDVGQIVDLAVDDRGDILLLTYRDGRNGIVRCDYRGRARGQTTLTALPRDFADFTANRMAFHRGTLLLASTLGLKIAVVDLEGRFVKGHDLFRLFELEEKDRGVTELSGFSVDAKGNVLMTVAVLFRAFVLAPDGTLQAFGRAGGGPGRFNIAGGIARDSRDNILIVDKLKGGVLIFDRQLSFVSQLSGYGIKRGQLVFPDDLVIDTGDRVYVTQTGRRGVSVFKLAHAADLAVATKGVGRAQKTEGVEPQDVSGTPSGRGK
jgi:hypothetical protein